jgi:hypothetical protein
MRPVGVLEHARISGIHGVGAPPRDVEILDLPGHRTPKTKGPEVCDSAAEVEAAGVVLEIAGARHAVGLHAPGSKAGADGEGAPHIQVGVTEVVEGPARLEICRCIDRELQHALGESREPSDPHGLIHFSPIGEVLDPRPIDGAAVVNAVVRRGEVEGMGVH